MNGQAESGSGVVAAVVALVADMASGHIRTVEQACRGIDGYDPVVAASVKDALPKSQAHRAQSVLDAWAGEPHLPGVAVAIALQTARRAKEAADAATTQAVLTGPDVPTAPVRLTSVVVSQLIDAATERVVMVSFAAYYVHEVIEALRRAEQRGVKIRLILESPENLDGAGGQAAFAEFPVYEWPLDKRRPPEAKLHAKAVIVDGRDVLITSANLTNAAFDKNLELGVLCKGGTIAAQVQNHFDALIDAGVLAPKTG